MLHLLFLAIVASFASQSTAIHPLCPLGLQPLFNGACGVRIHNGTYTYKAALALCHGMDAFLPSSLDDEENEHLRIVANGSRIILGMALSTCNWDDGNEVHYTNYRYQTTCDGSNGITTLNPTDGKWDDWNGVFDTVVCTAPPKFDPRCTDFGAVSEWSTVCYDFHGEQMTWNDAAFECYKDNAKLAIIHDSDTNAFFRRTAVAQGITTNIHIGLSSFFNGYNFSWADDTQMDYNNFAKGFPQPAFGGCATMQITHQQGQWMNEPCDGQPSAFICTRPADTEPEDEHCPEDVVYQSGDNIFSPGYPARYSATECEYLVTGGIGSKIRVEVVEFAVNTCCATLSITDGVFGGNEIVTLTGQYPRTNFTSTQSSVRIAWKSTEQGELLGWHLRVFVE